MLKQVRHISEGTFYGLRVTNKARKLSLDKELRNLEACEDVQSHVYRKEEQELINTLKRLQQTKHHPFEQHEDHHYPDRLPSHHDKQHSRDETPHLRRPSERTQGKLQVKVKSELSDQKSSAKVPCQVEVVSDASDVSVIISLSPIATSVAATKQSTTNSLPPVAQPPKRETGIEIHRTQGFTSCVICNLPRYAHGRGNPNICTCHADPSKHPHHKHEHQASNNRRKSQTDEDDLKTFAAKRERRRSLEIDDLLFMLSTKKNHLNPAGHHNHHGRSRASSFEDDKKNHAHERAKAFEDNAAYVPGVGVHRRNLSQHNAALNNHPALEQGMRGRGSSWGENSSRKISLDEGRSRWSSDTEGRNRDSSFGKYDDPHYMWPLKEHYGSRHTKNREEEELHHIYNRLQRVFPLSDENPHATHLPLTKSCRDAAANNKDEDSAPVFSGIMHPDNIINHHYFLPYEAKKQDKHRTTTHKASHPPTGFHVMGIDRHVNRQEVGDISWLEVFRYQSYTLFASISALLKKSYFPHSPLSQ